MELTLDHFQCQWLADTRETLSQVRRKRDLIALLGHAEGADDHQTLFPLRAGGDLLKISRMLNKREHAYVGGSLPLQCLRPFPPAGVTQERPAFLVAPSMQNGFWDLDPQPCVEPGSRGHAAPGAARGLVSSKPPLKPAIE